MSTYRALFVLDECEFKYFDFNELITSFWLLKECCRRNWETFVTTRDNLYLNNNIPEGNVYEAKFIDTGNEIKSKLNKNSEHQHLNDFDVIFFRPDPPVNMDYLYATYILDYIDKSKTIVINDPTGIRTANEKLYINKFVDVAPNNITTSKINLIKEFLNKYNKIVLKPLNYCTGKGVFYLEKGDKNANSLLETVTNYEQNYIMAQEYIEDIENGEKRLIIMGGELKEEAILRIPNGQDFRLNIQDDKYLRKANITDAERELCGLMAKQFLEDGLYLVGLDVVGEKITEINVTSPAFFIKEVNALFNTQLEIEVIDYVESLIDCLQNRLYHFAFNKVNQN